MKFRPIPLLLALAGAFAQMPATAIELIARGSLPGDGADMSGRTEVLENGAPANLLGGMGSGLAWAGGNTFLALPDRGPNAVTWNAFLDNTVTYVPRFHTITLDLVASPEGSPLPYTVLPTLQSTTLLYSDTPLTYKGAVPAGNKANKFYFSGRSDNFAVGQSSLTSANARFDPEGIRVSAAGGSVFVTDEYGPYIYKFSRKSGKRKAVYTLPEMFGVANVSAVGATEISGNTVGRVANKGMEGLAITPDGKTLFGFMQSPLIQDGGDGGRANRIVKIDVKTGAVSQYAYDNYIDEFAKAYNSSEILALNSHEFLVLERDGKGLGDNSVAVVKRLYKVDLAGATEVSGLSGADALLAVAPTKTLFLDIKAALNAAGIADAEIPAKIEGMAFGEDIVVGDVVKHTLYIANDNDFLQTAPGGLQNPNQWYVFAFTDADLGGSVFENQRFKSVPAED